jgi:biopolymer transport protein ExbD
MKIPSASHKRRARIEIIPLIDIIFFLLATFVMVSLSMVKNQGIPVNLPKAKMGQVQEKEAGATVTVTITESNRLYLDKELVDTQTLPERLKTLQAQQPDLRVVFNGDELAYFGDVVRALDQTRRAGIERVAIQTTGAAPPAPEKP